MNNSRDPPGGGQAFKEYKHIKSSFLFQNNGVVFLSIMSRCYDLNTLQGTIPFESTYASNCLRHRLVSKLS